MRNLVRAAGLLLPDGAIGVELTAEKARLAATPYVLEPLADVSSGLPQ